MEKLDKIKEIIEKEDPEKDCKQIFDNRNWIGDRMRCIYKNDNVQLDICDSYCYFEVFGLTNEEFEELENYVANR